MHRKIKKGELWAKRILQKRDISKLWEKQDVGIENQNGEKVVIAMYGLENQTKIDKEMPFRVIGYDGAKYRGQINQKEKRKHFPVVTMVLYFGERHWDEVLKLMSVLTEDNRFLKVQQESRGEVKNMCEVLDRVENRGIAKGLSQGIRAMIEMAKKYGVSRENVIHEIEEQYSMSEEEAKEKVQEYWS